MGSNAWLCIVLGASLAACGDNDSLGDIVLDQMPAAVTDATHAVFAFHIDGEPTAAFSCEVDGGAAAPCTSPFQVDVTDGDHTFEVSAGGTPATVSWHVDTVAPDTTITAAPAALVNTAPATFVFSGTPAADVALIQCAIDDAAFATCSSPTTLTLADGAHRFQARAIDTAGNIDPTPALAAWTIDTTPPTLAITSGPTGSIDTTQATFGFSTSLDAAVTECSVDAAPFAACVSPVTTSSLGQGAHTFTVNATDLAGNTATASRSFTVDTFAPTVTITSGPSGPTKIAAPTWTFTVGGAPTTTQCQIDGGTFTACSDSFTSATLADGPHGFVVQVADLAGNLGSDSRAIVVDTVVPTVTITSGPSGPTNIVAPIFTFTTTDAPTSILCSMDGGTPAPCTTVTTFVSQPLAPGAHLFEVDVADAAGNASSATSTFSLDTSAPTVVITSGPSGPTNNATPTFTFTTAGNPTVTQCRFDAGAFTDCVAGSFSATLADGAHTFQVQVIDAATNVGNATQSFTVDTVAPTVTITGGPNGTTSNPSPTFTFVTAGSPTSTQCQIDAGAPAPCSGSFTTATLGGGPHVFTVQVQDAAGNTGSASRNFSIDSTAPSVSITSGPPAATNNPIAVFTFTFGATAVVVHCSVDGGAFTDCLSGTFTTAVLSEASHTFEVEACDASSVCANDTRTFTVDLTPPTATILTGPADPVPTNNVTPSFTFSTAGAPTTIQCRITDVANPNAPFVACTTSFTATAALVDGQHTFEVQVIDAATNAASATRAFTVDTVAPGATITGGPSGPTNLKPLPSFTFVIFGGTAATIGCAYDTAAFVDCSSLTFAVPAAFADGSHEGTHAIHIKTTDLAGNAFTASQSFVVDTIAPVVTIAGPGTNPATDVANPSFTITMSTGGTQPLAVRCQVDGGSFAACSSPFSPGSLGEGTHTLVVQATDPATNVGTATQVFAIDTQRPVVAVIAPFIPSRTSTARPAVFFTVSDASPTTITCAIDGGPFAACTSGFGATSDLSEAPHTYHIQAIDNAGNPATVVDVPFIEDRTPPDVAITGHPVNPTNDTTPTFTFTTGADAATVQCTMDSGQPIQPCTSPIKFDASNGGPLSPGDHTFTVTVADNAVPANSASASFAFHLGTCGDGVAQGTEACDMSDLRGLTCATDGFVGGTLKCTTGCTLDTSSCTQCGNGTIDAGEQCDGAALGGATCSSQGFSDGALGCSSSCTFDTSLCFAPADSGFTGPVCFDGVKYNNAGQGNIMACSETAGVFRNATVTPTNPLWTAVNGVSPTSINNLHGRAIFGNTGNGAFGFIADNSTGNNAFRSNDATGTTGVGTWPANSQGSYGSVNQATKFELFNAKIGAGSYGTIYAGWSPLTGFATIVHGSNTPATIVAHTLGPRRDGTVPTGTARSVVDNNGSFQVGSGDIYVGVFGEKPDGSAAVGGGIYWTCNTNFNSTNASYLLNAGTTIERDNGIPGSPDGVTPGDRDLVWSLVGDSSTTTMSPSRTCEGTASVAGVGSRSVTGATFAGTTATFTVDSALGFTVGGPVVVAGMSGGCTGSNCVSPYNGTWTVSATTGTTFTATLAATPTANATLPIIGPYLTTYYAALRGGGGIYKTTNGGASWLISSTGIPAGTEVYVIAIDVVVNAQSVWAATDNGLYHSTNGGGSWTLVGFGGASVRAVTTLNSIKSGVQKIYIGVEDAVGIYSN